MAAAHSKVSALVFQQNVSILPSPSVFLERKVRKTKQDLRDCSYSAMESKTQKPLLSLEEAPFIVSRWEGEARGGGRLLMAALMLACLLAFHFLDPYPRGWDCQLWKKHNRMAVSSPQTRQQQMSVIGVGGTSSSQTTENLKGWDWGLKQRDRELWRGGRCLWWDNIGCSNGQGMGGDI